MADASHEAVRQHLVPLLDAGIGVVVLSGTGRERDALFLDRVRQLSRRILDEGLVDRLVVPLQSLEDSAISARLLRSLDDPRCVGIEDDLSPEELMRFYRGARFLVGRRLHGGLFAMLVGTPVILFATDGVKTHGVMSALGLSSRVAPYPDFHVEQVHGALVDLLTAGLLRRHGAAGPQDRLRRRQVGLAERVVLGVSRRLSNLGERTGIRPLTYNAGVFWMLK